MGDPRIFDPSAKPIATKACGGREDYLPAPKIGQHSAEILEELE